MNTKDTRIDQTKSFIVVSDLYNPKSVTTYKLIDMTKDTYVSKEGQFYKDLCFPCTELIFNSLIAVCTERARLKKAHDDSMELVYQLSNKIARGEM